MSASDSTIPSGMQETMEEKNWTEQEREAWIVFHEATPGDEVTFAERSTPMEVVDTGVEDGQHWIEVAKPRADGTYRAREKYHRGNPKFTSEIGRATDLEWAERTPPPRELDDADYAQLLTRQMENAQDRFLREDYESWDEAVQTVVDEWANEVAFHEWTGYPNHPEWRDGDAEIIFESVVEHADYAPDDDASLRDQAEEALYHDIYTQGRTEAEANIITSAADYADVVDTLTHHAIDRYERKSYSSARVAVRDTISNWIADRQEPAYEAIIEYGNDPFDDTFYEAEEDPKEEKAFDILDIAVWDEVKNIQRERGEHDPTSRGMTYTTYRDTVDALVEETLRRYDGEGYLRTTVKDVVDDWANEVEAREWGGHRHRIYADGDVEDIFSSAAIHADANPFIWNPFAEDKERRMAVQAVTGDVVNEAENAIDDDQWQASPEPVDEYLQGTLGLDMTYGDLAEADADEEQEVAGRVMSEVDGSEVGWTFVDEVVEHGGTVPEETNDWLLIDYGVIREGDRLRKLAWFNRETGNVLVLSGMAVADPPDLDDVDDPYETFHVTHHLRDEREPAFLIEDVDLEEALEYVYDFVGSNRADFRIIDTGDDVYVQDQITDEDLNAGGVMDALVPNTPWGSDDLITAADVSARTFGREASFFKTELARMAAFTAFIVIPKSIGDRLEGVRVEPQVDKRLGIGVNISKEYGADADEPGVGGKADVDVNVRPQTFSKLARRYAPKFARYGFREGDIGAGAASRLREGYEYVERDPWGSVLLDEFGGSIQSVASMFRRGENRIDRDIYETEEQQRRAAFLEAETAIDPSDPKHERDMDGTVVSPTNPSHPLWEEYGEEYDRWEDTTDFEAEAFRWDEMDQEDIGLSGTLVRGLDAEAITSAADYVNVEDWLQNNLTFWGSDFIEDGSEEPTFEEWRQSRYGPGQPAGPEEEARQLARYHSEVAAADEAPDPYEEVADTNADVLGAIEDQPDEEDYDMSSPEGEFGNNFDDVAAKFSGDENIGEGPAGNDSTR